MRTEFYIQEGQIITSLTNKDRSSLFSLDKFFKRMLTRYNVGFSDTCCTNDVTKQPVVFNTTAGHLQYFHTTTLTWTNVPGL